MNNDEKNCPIAFINLKNLQANYHSIQQLAKGCKVAAVVKANGFGLGAIEVSQALYDAGCRDLFVARVNEAVELRQAITDPYCHIYLLGNTPYDSETLDMLIHQYITLSVTSHDEWVLLNNYSPNNYPKIRTILHIETGMNRLGIKNQNDMQNITNNRPDNIDIAYVMSHLVEGEQDKSSKNTHQLEKFNSLCQQYFPNIKKSLANSSGIFLDKTYHQDMVRPGFVLYGGYYKNDSFGDFRPQPVLSLYAPIGQVYELKKGDSISYNHLFTAEKDMMIACAHFGYADGLPRDYPDDATPGGYINGVFCPIVGRVTMDLTMFDISHLSPLPQAGNMVELIGDNQPLENAFGMTHLFGYQTLTNLRKRIIKKYLT